MSKKQTILMVCLGNSCRSPIAEAVFQQEINKLGLGDSWEVDSAALLEYHVGNKPEPRALATLREAGIRNYHHIARQITVNDFYKFDWMFAMDNGILYDLYQMKPKDSHIKIELLGQYDPSGETNIRDPLFDQDSSGFRKAFEQSTRSIKAFLHQNESISD